MNTLNNCPVCQGAQSKLFLNAKDHFLTKENFTIVECCSCGLKFTNPRPNDSDLGKYYQSEEYISHSNTNKGIVSWLYKAVRNYTLFLKEKIALSYVSRGTLLDYGCGSGYFISYCQSKGWKVAGVEPDDGARNLAKQGVKAVYKTKEELVLNNEQKKFSVISLWHVLEHLSDLNEVMAFLDRSLEENGVLLIALPNPESYDAKKYKGFWAAYDLPRHLYHFNEESLCRLLGKQNFVLKEKKPMYFDSYYVSMLSEKYLNGKSNIFAAGFSGLISNLKARRNGEYSSLIYIFKRA
jgi:2-polyprenyl-3-methyl-5-hydroxy-6-metoxy-1,4-benzoquinol methylase